MTKSFSKILLLLFIASCNDPNGIEVNTDNHDRKFEDIKSITSRFISHQADTQEKDQKIVATALFNEQGIVEEFVQHMTYPYNLESPETREFWAGPDNGGILLIMDGLDLGHAEKNFLFGNSWPLAYAEAASKDHPLFQGYEGLKFESTIKMGPFSLPEEIETMNGQTDFFGTTIERFEYADQKVTKYKQIVKRDMSMFPKEMQEAMGANDGEYVKEDVDFVYEGDKLTELSYKNIGHKFYYEGDLQVKSEFYLNNRIYNYRLYFYDEDGFKVRTEIYNVEEEPEYTIYFDYDFY